MSSTVPAPKNRAIRRGAMALAALALLAAALLLTERLRRTNEDVQAESRLLEALPRQTAERGFVSSSKCQTCHPQEYASWHASFHRQMTQAARPETVLGPFDGATVESEGQLHRMVRRGEELWVETSPTEQAQESSDAAAIETPTGAVQPTARRVVMTTGAHHMQLYWAANGAGNLLDELPLVYIRDEPGGLGQWAPLEASYLSPTPPGMGLDTHWNTSCILCHATAGNPRRDRESGSTTTRVAELGIACEACHGPAKAHVALHQKPAAGRERAALDRAERIVNPEKISPARSAQVCGYCHAVASFLDDRQVDDYFISGGSFRPGDDLSQSRVTLLPSKLSEEQLEGIRHINPIFDGSFWSDGMVRVAGREYNGLLESTCHQQGAMICLSCHSMHHSEPNDQLAAKMAGNQACYQCHPSYRENLAAHSHHPAESSGSLCYNCHMPHTTYGLFKAIRSHQISSPSAAVTLTTGRPNACNLCHLDQSLAWTAEKLADWYGQTSPELDDEQRSTSAALVWLLRGNSIQRVLLAWVAGWTPAVETSDGRRLVPHLAQLLTDPSPAIRLVAYRSIRSIAPELVENYNFVSPEAEQLAVQRGILDGWRRAASDERATDELLFIAPDGQLQADKINELLRGRDPEEVQVRE
ncbi:MAG TPA: cytochrome c3 family protein [Pirellulales bacterium]|nr:cytochrome c3 family protein [Pirellulales bacterium]